MCAVSKLQRETEILRNFALNSKIVNVCICLSGFVSPVKFRVRYNRNLFAIY